MSVRHSWKDLELSTIVTPRTYSIMAAVFEQAEIGSLHDILHEELMRRFGVEKNQVEAIAPCTPFQTAIMNLTVKDKIKSASEKQK